MPTVASVWACASQVYRADPPVPDDVQSVGSFHISRSTVDHTTGYELRLVEHEGRCTGLLVVWQGTLEPNRYPIEEVTCSAQRISFTTTKEISPQFSKPNWRPARRTFTGQRTADGLVLKAEPSMSELELGPAPQTDGDAARTWKDAVRYRQAAACIDDQLAALTPLRRRIVELETEKAVHFRPAPSFALLCDEQVEGQPGLTAVLRSDDDEVRSALADLVGGAASFSTDYADIPRRGHPVIKCLARLTASGELDEGEVAAALAAYPTSRDPTLQSGVAAWAQEQPDPAAAVKKLRVHTAWADRLDARR